MPFKYKLSRRLAISRTTMLAVSIMAVACEIVEIAEPTSQEEDVIAVSIQPDSITLQPNQTQRFRVYLNKTADGDTVQVAVVYVATGGSIAQDGLYTAGQTLGIYRVIAATADGVLADTASVTVVPVPVASVAVSPATATIAEGMTIQLLVEPRDSVENPLTGRAVSWASNNPEVAMVSVSGLVTALTAGITTISAASEGASGTAAITVTAARAGKSCRGPEKSLPRSSPPQ